MSTHICLVSRQPMPNLLGVLALQPKHVVLLATPQEDAVRGRIERELKRLRIATSSKRIDPYDLEDVYRACRDVIASPPATPVILNATGGTKISTLAAFSAVQSSDGAEAFYVNTERGCIQWLRPRGRAEAPLDLRLTISQCLEVHGITVAAAGSKEASHPNRLLSIKIAGLAARAEPLLAHFRRIYYLCDKERRALDRAIREAADDFPGDLGPAQRELLDALCEAGMVTLQDGAPATVRSPEDLRYLGGGRWLEEYCEIRLRELHVFDEVKANLVLRWGEEAENEVDVVTVRGGRLFLFACKTGGAVASSAKDLIAQDEVFKLETLRDLAGGTFARAILVAGSKMTSRLKERCGRLGIQFVDVGNLHQLDEFARKVAGA
jgi:hypothetical protein